ncbi:hypothetical protein RRG08_051471 [Elysia crispata]|uniref:Uncharacterized protein n=1 Tax=Elysia crispata TaxID=231223 RepID=A0AAE1B290_9GAST|nr:hypothetical protein RRG08_051471 [Elysia crispata]
MVPSGGQRSASLLAIDKAFEAETCANPQDDLPKELEEEEYHKATHTHSMGGATAYRFGKWLSKEDIRPTRRNSTPLLMGGATQPIASGSGKEDIRPHPEKFRPAWRELPRLTGAIQLSAWEFAPNTHPYTVGRVGESICRGERGAGSRLRSSTATSSTLGDMVAATAREVIYSVGVKPCIRFPARDLAVLFVGKCARHGDPNCRYSCATPSEGLRLLCNTLGGSLGPRLLKLQEKADNVHYIKKYRDGKTRAQWFHIFGHSYSPVHQCGAPKECSGGYPRKRSSRSLHRLPSTPRLSVMRSQTCLLRTNPAKYGQWRKKSRSYEWRPEAATPGKSNAGASTHWRQRLRGGCTWQAKRGSGKTEWAVKTFAGRRLVRAHSRKTDLAGYAPRQPSSWPGLPHQAQTIHHYLCIRPTRPIEEWDPVRARPSPRQA